MIYEKKLLNYRRAGKIVKELKRRGKKIVLVSGAYDITHAGHAYFFEKAKEFGDVLFVSVGSDKNIRVLKGRARPILSQELRVRMVAALAAVDYAVAEREKMLMPGKINFWKLSALIEPDVFAVNNTDSAIAEKRRFLKKRGVRLVSVDVKKGPDVSTTKIIESVVKKTKGFPRV